MADVSAQGISVAPFLWFDKDAESAAEFYVSLFPNSRIVETSRYGESGPGPKGSVMTISFEIAGQRITALNGGPNYVLSPAFSLFVSCDTQAEIDLYWNRLGEGGEILACGWLTDRFGLSWQIVPRTLMRLMQDSDREKAQRVMQAMLSMKKLEIAGLERAYAQK
jgi:predicted 3-demethylubiquinone-9 3-methyltransferase (glyoxalase superfamily)